MKGLYTIYQIRYNYHTDTDNRQLYYDCHIVYDTYEAAVQHLKADWDGVRDDCDILEYITVKMLILKTYQ